jgi:uncharacterized tellurite resistance protein B-like protein
MDSMTPTENLHYAIGELAYAMARADGFVQEEERKRFQDIVSGELKDDQYFDISSIIFQLMDRKMMHQNSQTAYNWAMHEIRTNSHYLSPRLKEKFIRVMEKIAEAYPPVTEEEKTMIENFRRDIEPLHGDPLYYGNGG